MLDSPKSLKRIYTASENGFKASRFHAACDDVPHTLVLIENEFGKILGGYTPLTWNSGRGFIFDEPGLSFLFSVNELKKMTLKEEKRKKAIQCIPEYGPVFGSGADLAISD